MPSNKASLPESIGRYAIEDILGRGAVGVVYLARDPNIDRLVALKTLQPQAATDPDRDDEVKERFLNEGRASGRLRHPGIVMVHDAGEDEDTGIAFLAMEYVAGGDLADQFEQRIKPRRLMDILAGVASALDHAHAQGIVHRDVKPGNIMVAPDGRALLTDFGIARLGSSTVTQEGQVMGSPAYMAPEQVRGKEVTPAADLFSLAVVCYEGLTGRRPFRGADIISTTHAIAFEEPPPPSELRVSMSPAVDVVLAKALSKSAGERYPTATALVSALEEALFAEVDTAEGLAVVEAPHGPAPASWRPPVTLAALALVVVLALVSLWALAPGGETSAGEAQDLVATAPVPEAEPGTVGEPGPTAPETVQAEPVDVRVESRTAVPRILEREAPIREPHVVERPEQVAQPIAEVELQSEPESPPVQEAEAAKGLSPPAPPADSLAAPALEDPASLRTGTLQLEFYALKAGVLVVRDGDREIRREDMSSHMSGASYRLKTFKKGFVFVDELAEGRHDLSFAYEKKKGRTLECGLSVDVKAGQTQTLVLELGTFGRKLDVRLEE